MIKNENLSDIITNATNNVFADINFLENNIIEEASKLKPMKRRVKFRKLILTVIAAISIFSLTCFTAFAQYTGIIELPFFTKDIAKQLGVNPEVIKDDHPNYGIFSRSFFIMTEEWNRERQDNGLELFNTSLICQMVEAGDLKIEEVYALFGKVPSPTAEVEKITLKYNNLPELQKQLDGIKAEFERVYSLQKDNKPISDTEKQTIEEYRKLEAQVNDLTKKQSEELKDLNKKYNPIENLVKEVPEKYKQVMKIYDENGVCTEEYKNYSLAKDIINLHYVNIKELGQNKVITPYYSLMSLAFNRAKNRYRAANYDEYNMTTEQCLEAINKTVITKDDFEYYARLVYGQSVTIKNMSVENADKRLNIYYNSTDETYKITPELSDARMHFTYVSKYRKTSTGYIFEVAFLNKTFKYDGVFFGNDGGYKGTYYDDNGNAVLEHKDNNIWPEDYAVSKIMDKLPKWEFELVKVDNQKEVSLFSYQITSIKKLS